MAGTIRGPTTCCLRGGRRNALELVNGAGVSGSAADGTAQQRGAVEGAEALAVAGGLEGSGVGAAPLREVGQRLADGPMEALQLGVVEVEAALLRVELGAAEAAGVPDPEVAAVGEADDEPVPGLEVAVRGVLELLDPRRPVDQQPPGHAEPEAE